MGVTDGYLGIRKSWGDHLGKKFAGGKTPDTSREEHVVWGRGN